MSERHLAVGDIHGSLEALTTLAAFVPFCAEDVLVTLGDYVNRGPDTRGVLDWLVTYPQRGKLVALRGNHDLMMLEARAGGEAWLRWMQCGGEATLASYGKGGAKGELADVPAAHWEFLEQTRGWYEIAGHFFVHANAYPDFPLDEQPENMLYWEKLDHPAPHQSGKVMVCGHTAQKSGSPRSFGHAICIDTWAWGKGWLTCLDVASGQYWQANRDRETRRGWLEAEV